MENNNATQLERPLGQSEPTSEISREGILEISAGLRHLLADAIAFYVKIKNFHWHMTGRHFRDDHLLLDEQAAQRTRPARNTTTLLLQA
jgi:starvation-inducible DNA-binding protein